MYEIPNRPWLRLEEAEAALLTSGKVLVSFEEFEGEKYVSGDALIETSRILSEAAFAGSIKLMGRPAKPHEGVGFAELQDIPATYFRKCRSFYGQSGIGRLSFEPTAAELRQDAIDITGEGGETDWVDVLVERSGFVAMLGGSKSHSGSPGRPTSMHLVEIEFRKRIEQGIAEATNSAEADFLAGWLRATHSNEPNLTPKTIRNRLGDLRRKLLSAQN